VEGGIRQTLKPTELAVRYAMFAAVAIGANLAAQAAVFAVYDGPLELAAAIAIGTIVGLIVKFELDRRLIFYAPRQDVAATGLTFLLYSASGLVTTAIFWATETLFYLASGKAEGSQYAGGLVGLTIGYVLKYRLDKKYAFRG
jgi:putative flippase GtrA